MFMDIKECSKHMDRKDVCQVGVCGWECGNRI